MKRKNSIALYVLQLALQLIIGLFLSNPSFGNEWVTAKAGENGARVYKSPQLSSQLLGTYPKDSRLLIYTPAKKDFYAIHFSPAWQGVEYGWIPTSDVNLANSEELSKSSTNKNRKIASDKKIYLPWSNRLFAVTDMNFVNPSDYLTEMGSSPASVTGLGFGLGFGHRFSNRIEGSIQLSYFSLTTSTPSSMKFGATSYSIIPSLRYLFFGSRIFTLHGEGGVGLALSTVENSNSDQLLTISSITSIPIHLKITGMYTLFTDYALSMSLGYTLNTLSAVNVLTQTSGETQSTANINFGGLTIGLGLNYLF